MRRSQWFWLAAGWIGFAILPWYNLALLSAEAWPASGLFLAMTGEAPWLLPLVLPLALPLIFATRSTRELGLALVAAGIAGLAYALVQGFALGLHGWAWPFLEALLGETQATQIGFGTGAMVLLFSFLFLMTEGLAALGWMKGDRFTTGSIALVIGTILFFVFLPVSNILFGAAVPEGDSSAIASLFARLTDADIWSLNCLVENRRCGVFWNSLILAILTGVITTLLGLSFALVATRTNFPFKKPLRLLTVLPIITPPFVIGLAIILLFGRNGTVTLFVADLLDIRATRWVYGLPGILITQALAFTPIAFLVLIGVVQGIAPSMEEAAHTLRANRWHTFKRVTWPLLRPGLANAFLIGFIESLADFGNPLVLGGNYDVLSTKIFFAVVGSQNDPGRAAALAIVLLSLCVGAFYVQRRWLGSKSYTTLSGKGDAGRPSELPQGLRWICYATALPWATFTFILYAMIMFGGFVTNWGRDNSFTLKHYLGNFGIEWTEFGLLWSGRAWNSLFTTLEIAAISAPLTAGMGLLTAYLLVRQRFAGQSAFEFITMLSFAIPGTVIGVSYILAFNEPPIELTGTASILVLCFIFRNMPVSIRAGVAAMSQIDKSLDECALTLGASSAQTVRRVILPLLRPAIVAALVYSFVRAITSVSAVIFLVSARHDLATSYIVGRVENGEFGLAIAYSSALIFIMGAGIALIQFIVGERRISRRQTTDALSQEAPA
ncbi:iron ABC transporter permease [Stappia sp. F7233]|uniref:Iron ABC transporter permease n=1 Tax=Stappia albiluteola TaxID=2758565 RepID=A0A839A934_9HYPH|nr:iron ABC transporter permease [Stappia albiluteola]MBA5776043.1 iron ABC transporter permease [Stappia albiluteola]